MLASELDFELPSDRIAQSPTDRRDRSRLLVYRRKKREVSHHHFHELTELLPSDLSIFRNDVSVLKARLPGKRPTGGTVECLLLRPEGTLVDTWRCLLKPGGKTARAGKFFLPDEYEATVLESLPSGEYRVQFDLPKDDDPADLAQRIGALPLPPYVRRPADETDELRYQTVYANTKNRTAVAAPTAGLHFTPEILQRLEEDGHSIHNLTLSVGLGTFRPIETERIEDHPMHAEEYSIGPKAKKALLAKDRNKLAIGTTSVRTIEHYLSDTDPKPEKPTVAKANLFIRPPYSFRGVDHLLTNFHLPGSTLLCLVAAFLSPGKEDGLAILKDLYAQAVASEYRFFSYGDAMLIL
ncbi:MAG: tRNA preQ1(34) S-adenosylmethionine ribosyltransferase-isomerase QueA [Opitutae bacterium]|jgi:S-adenosylmethionine:tRNA ribosyltransferase-isomerase|nr:tRNA preQ1(34) S-adenosylmethionine ribosyltransferase-isomerase QueA [Opitutae bacterium]